MKLLIVTSVATTLRAFLLPYARHFRAQGWQVDAMAGKDEDFAACEAEFSHLYPVDLSRNPFDPGNLWRAPARIRRVVAAGDYDLVHVHTPVAAFVTRLALRHLRRRGRPRVIYTAHGFHFHRGGAHLTNLAFLALEKLAGAWTDHLVVINREDESAARRYRLVPKDRLSYMPGIGIDLRDYRREDVTETDIAALREELGLAPSDHLLLIVAAMDPGKRHRDAFAALARLGREGVVLACAGGGPQEAALRQLATDLGLEARVRFLGFRQDIPRLLAAASAMLLPSEREGLPRSIMEAMAMGTPVIGTCIRGVEDLLQGGCGIMTEVGDVEALRAAMARVLDHPGEAAAMAARGRARVQACDLRSIMALHEALYQEAGQQRSQSGVQAPARLVP